jgi:hypothetical protein
LLDDASIERYARQIVVPGIGAAGQEKLLQSVVILAGHPRGCRTAALYLEAAGVTLAADSPAPSAIVIANPSTTDDATLDFLTAKAAPVCWYEADEDGFVSGVHPGAPLPRRTGRSDTGAALDAVHDAGACAAAALACAVILGLETGTGPTRLAP